MQQSYRGVFASLQQLLKAIGESASASADYNTMQQSYREVFASLQQLLKVIGESSRTLLRWHILAPKQPKSGKHHTALGKVIGDLYHITEASGISSSLSAHVMQHQGFVKSPSGINDLPILRLFTVSK
jgi:hypothetical protein